MNQIILHVDLDSFFATAQQQVNPALRGKPVGIVKARGRTCIIASSKEAKRYGVKTGSRVDDARKLCPNIILVPAEFDKYEDLSMRFIKICNAYSPLCEVFSLDECFVDVTESHKFWQKVKFSADIEQLAWQELVKATGAEDDLTNALKIAFNLKKRVSLELGDWITCSVGIAENRLLAKLASGWAKSDSIFWINRQNAWQILDKSNLMDVCGLGFGLYKHLLSLGIDNFAKLRTCSLSFLYKHFGPFWSVHLYNISRGIDTSLVNSYRELAEAKSVGRTYTAHRLLTSRTEIEKLIRNLCEEAAAKARHMGLMGRYVGISLRAKDESFWGHKTLKSYIDDGKTLFDICLKIIKNWPVKSVIFCGVTLTMLSPKKYLAEPLFESDRRRTKLIEKIDKVNDRFGDYTIFPAKLLGTSIIRPEVTGYFGDKKFRLNFLRNN